MRIQCPHCKSSSDDTFHYRQVKGEPYWCGICGELSFFKTKSSLRKLSAKERNEFYEKHEGLKSDNWLPNIKKKDICFDVVTWLDGVFNPYEHQINFYEAERLLRLQYHQYGTMPQVGDFITGATIAEPDKRQEKDFVVIGKQWGLDDCNEWKVFVIPEDEYLKKYS